MVALVVLAILTLAGVAVTAGVRRERRRQAAEREVLIRHGFKPCPDGVTGLERSAGALRGSPGFTVRRPWAHDAEGTVVYWYEVNSEDADSKQRIAADGFLCTLRRPTEQPFLLYLSPAKLGKGLGAQLIEKVLVVTAPAGLSKLAAPPGAHGGQILAAFGAPGASWNELVDPDQLALFAAAARHGIFAIRCRGEHCALEMFGAYARKAMEPVGWDDTWAFVRRVARASLPAASGGRSAVAEPGVAAPVAQPATAGD